MANSKTFDVRIKQKAAKLTELQAANKVYLENELILAYDNEDVEIYVGNGTDSFLSLSPIYSSKWVLGRNEVVLEPVQLLASAWDTSTKTQIVTVPGLNSNESEQLVVPTYASGSRGIAMSCGIDFIINNDGTVTFTCNTIPTENIIVYFGMFGKKSDDDSENKPVIRTDIDSTLSEVSTNPVENKAITTRILAMEADIRNITGTEVGEEPEVVASLPTLNTKLMNVMTYSATPTPVGTYVKDDGTKETVDRVTIPFSITINRDNLVGDTDISCFAVESAETINVEMLANSYWTGKNTTTGDFFGSCPIIITNEGKINLLNVPVTETSYTLTGNIIVEYI